MPIRFWTFLYENTFWVKNANVWVTNHVQFGITWLMIEFWKFDFAEIEDFENHLEEILKKDGIRIDSKWCNF